MKEILRKSVSATLPVALLFLVALPAHAQVDIGMEFAAPMGLATNDVREIVAAIIRAFLGMVGFVMFIQILHGGMKYMVAGGSEDAREAAVAGIKNSVVGFIIIMSASSITHFVVNAVSNATHGGIL